MKTVLEVKQSLNEKNIPFEAIYLYGSQIYGTASSKSDWDFLVVSDYSEKIEGITFESTESFLEKLKTHDIRTLECILANEQFKIESESFKQKTNNWNLDLNLLRIGVSSKASNSWVKAKKKIEVENEPYLGLKSLFHSLRMIDFGIQIATHGRIVDYSSSNHYWQEIQNETSWISLKNKYQPVYNSLKTEFRNKTNSIN